MWQNWSVLAFCWVNTMKYESVYTSMNLNYVSEMFVLQQWNSGKMEVSKVMELPPHPNIGP